MAKGSSLVKRSIFPRFCCLAVLVFAVSCCFILQILYNKELTVKQPAKEHLYSVQRKTVSCGNRCAKSSTKNSSEILGKVRNALGSSFVASTKVNGGREFTTTSTACVVDPAIIDCQNLGFASFLLVTIELISLCHALGSSHPTIIWRTCMESRRLDRTVNSWKSYFEPVNPGILSQANKVLCVNYAVAEVIAHSKEINDNGLKVSPILNNSFRNRSSVYGFELNKIITSEERQRVSWWIRRYVRPRDEIKAKVEHFYQNQLAGFNLLGVHVRGTDHWLETESKRLPRISWWITSASVILEALPHPKKIFVASDNNEAILKFVLHFGKDMVAFTNATRAPKYKGSAPHYKHNGRPDPLQMGSQVLTDILLLAKCDHFLHAESSVASLASYFNPRMKSHFLEDEVQENVHIGMVMPFQEDDLDDNDDDSKNISDESRNDDNDVETNIQLAIECFKKNSADSVCPNTSCGLFVSVSEALQFLSLN